MKSQSIETLRKHLFQQLDLLSSPSADVDMERARLVAELSQVVINTVKVEVDFAKVVKGAITLPFIENQPDSEERPYSPHVLPPSPAPAPEPAGVPDADKPRVSPMERALAAGPAADHPWRGLGARKVA